MKFYRGIVMLALPLAGMLPAQAADWRVEASESVQLPDTVAGASALVPLPGGDLLAISDHADLYRLHPGPVDAALTVTAQPLGRLPGTDGKPMTGRGRDAEGAVLLADGRLAISFERKHRILAWRRDADGLPTGRAEAVGTPKAMAALPLNEGVEGMTRLADGRWLLAAETADAAGRWPVWIGSAAGSGWQAAGYRTDAGYMVSDVAGLPDGTLLVLQRSRAVLLGQLPELLAVPPPIRPGATLEGEVLLSALFAIPVANWEGLAVVPGATASHARVYTIGDNNYDPGQPNLLARLDLRR